MSPISQRLSVSSEISGSKTVSVKTTGKRKSVGQSQVDNLSSVAKKSLPLEMISKKQCLNVKKLSIPARQDSLEDSFDGAFLRYNRPISVLIDRIQEDEEPPIPTYFDRVWDNVLYLQAKVIGNMRGPQYSLEPGYKDTDRPISGSESTELEDITPKLEELFPESPKRKYNPIYFGDSLFPQNLDSDFAENLDSYDDVEEN